MNADPYAILELPWGASEAEIRQAFRKLALRYHPDRNGGSAEAEARFKLISAAFQRLKSAGFRLPGPRPRPASSSPRPPWTPPSSHQEDDDWEPPPRPEFWPDGERIHYPTQREIDELMRGVHRQEMPSWFSVWSNRFIDGVLYLYVGLMALCIVAGALMLIVLMVLGVRDLLGLN